MMLTVNSSLRTNPVRPNVRTQKSSNVDFGKSQSLRDAFPANVSANYYSANISRRNKSNLSFSSRLGLPAEAIADCQASFSKHPFLKDLLGEELMGRVLGHNPYRREFEGVVATETPKASDGSRIVVKHIDGKLHCVSSFGLVPSRSGGDVESFLSCVYYGEHGLPAERWEGFFKTTEYHDDGKTPKYIINLPNYFSKNPTRTGSVEVYHPDAKIDKRVDMDYFFNHMQALKIQHFNEEGKVAYSSEVKF